MHLLIQSGHTFGEKNRVVYVPKYLRVIILYTLYIKGFIFLFTLLVSTRHQNEVATMLF